MEDGVKNHSLFPLETCPHVSDEAFRQFHTVDREFFAALTRLLRRDPAESVQVAAFLLWLEKECGNSTVIKRVLSLPPVLINAAADEAALCVRCVESDTFLTGDGGSDVKVLSELLNFPNGVSLRFLHDNRIAVLRGVAKIITTVCWRAFADLFPAPPPPAMQYVINPYLDMPVSLLPGATRMTPQVLLPHHHHHPPPVADITGLPLHVLAAAQQRNFTSSNTPIKENDNQERIAADERTIFLTFSKGYPTTEDEVREYFTRKFGDFIEDLIMQEVEGDEQPLYAKMVAKTAAVMDGIVEGNKAKYSINGKHVWARKYVKKSPSQQQRSPPRGEASGSSPSSAKKA